MSANDKLILVAMASAVAGYWYAKEMARREVPAPVDPLAWLGSWQV